MNKIPCTFQNTEAKTFSADVCVFSRFGRFLPAAALSADCRFDSGLKSWIHVTSTVPYLRKNSFCCVKTVASNALNRWRIVVFDRLWANAAPTLNTAFSMTNVYSKWQIHCLLISSIPLLTHATSIYDRPKLVDGVFRCFPGQLVNLSDLSVQYHLFLYDRF